MQPASDTKHHSTLTVDFNHETRLHIQQDNREPSTANTLWIGGQVLAAYVQQFHPCNKHAPSQRVIELGSGVGLTACVRPKASPLACLSPSPRSYLPLPLPQASPSHP